MKTPAALAFACAARVSYSQNAVVNAASPNPTPSRLNMEGGRSLAVLNSARVMIAAPETSAAQLGSSSA
jgi:hypothetical protein